MTFTTTVAAVVVFAPVGIGCAGIGVPARLGGIPGSWHPPVFAPPHPAIISAASINTEPYVAKRMRGRKLVCIL